MVLRSLSLALVLLTARAAFGQSADAVVDDVVDDGRDAYTLFYRHPVNRQIALQAAAPDQDFRFGRNRGPLAFLADLSYGTEQVFRAGDTQARFHGYYIADTYWGVHLLDGLEANLNLLLLNPSASDGYRVSSQVNAGLALHGWLDLANPRGRRLRLEIYGTDLGWVTFGAGLLIEQTPLEGVTGRLSWAPLALTYTYIGRALWFDDDVIRTQLSAFGDRVGLMLIEWHKTDNTAAAPAGATSSFFVNAFVDLPLRWGLRVAAEAGVRTRSGLQTGALARADYLGRPLSRLELHVGYQFRWYAQGFSPRDVAVLPTSAFNTPQQEDAYVTNSFEYLGLASLFAQWSHTAMGEARLHLGDHVFLFGQGELWRRVASTTVSTIAFTPEGFAAPGTRTELFYRGGATFLPWATRPHRMNAFVTNKQVQSGVLVTDPMIRRFQPGTYVVLEFQAFL